MTKANVAAVVLAAGKGTRMRSARPKVLHALAGRPMILHLLAAVERRGLAKVVVVVGPGMESVAEAVAPHPVVVQREQRGTAHAVLAARAALAGFRGEVLVLYGDTPLVMGETLERLLSARREKPEVTVPVPGFRPEDPSALGWMGTGAGGALEAIVEHRDATAEQRAFGLCNSGVMVIDAALLFPLLERVGDRNAK